MNSAKITFQEKTQEVVEGRKRETWATYYVAWADLPALSVREQTDVHNRSLTDAITLEVRACDLVKKMVNDLKNYRAVYEGKPYTLNSADKSRSRQGRVRILASRTD